MIVYFPYFFVCAGMLVVRICSFAEHELKWSQSCQILYVARNIQSLALIVFIRYWERVQYQYTHSIQQEKLRDKNHENSQALKN